MEHSLCKAFSIPQALPYENSSLFLHLTCIWEWLTGEQGTRLSTKVCSPWNRQNGTKAQDEGLCCYLPDWNADPSSAFLANTSKLKIETFPSQLARRKNPSLGSGAITKFYGKISPLLGWSSNGRAAAVMSEHHQEELAQSLQILQDLRAQTEHQRCSCGSGMSGRKHLASASHGNEAV